MIKYIYFFLLLTSVSFAQTRQKLETRTKDLQKQIVKLNKELKANRQKAEGEILYFKGLEKKISASQRLMQSIKKESRFIDDDIYLTQLKINKLKREYADLKKEYSAVLVNSYKNRAYQNKIFFVIAAKDLSEGYRRVKYLRQYSDYQDKKSEEILEKKKQIEKTKKEKEKVLVQKQKNLAEQQEIANELDQERKKKQAIIQDYESRRSEIASNLKNNKAEYVKLENKIKQIIAYEVKLAKERAEAERKKREEEARRLAEERRKIELERQRILAERKRAEEEARRIAAERERAEAEAQRLAEARQKAEAERFRIEKERETAKRAEKKELAQQQKLAKIQAEKAKIEADRAKKLAEKKQAEQKKALEKVSSVENKVAKNDTEIKKVESAFPVRNTTASLSASFYQNRGRLPWPVKSGRIITRFGSSPHPILPSLTIESYGIDIATSRGQNATSVFNGSISAVYSVQGNNKAVLVQHGTYYTVYSNLSEVYVVKGQKVRMGEPIGKIYTDPTGNTVLQFQVWQETVKRNPEYWISR